MNTRVLFTAACCLALAAPAFPGCQPGNLIDNCGFPTNILGWNVTSGTASHQTCGGNCSSTPGELNVATTASANIVFSQCIDVSGVSQPAAGTGFGIDYRDSIANDIETLRVTVTDYSVAGCTPGNETGNSAEATDGITSTSYEQVSSTYTLGTSVTALSVLFRVTGEHPSVGGNGILNADFDDAFFGSNLVPVELQTFTVE